MAALESSMGSFSGVGFTPTPPPVSSFPFGAPKVVSTETGVQDNRSIKSQLLVKPTSDSKVATPVIHQGEAVFSLPVKNATKNSVFSYSIPMSEAMTVRQWNHYFETHPIDSVDAYCEFVEHFHFVGFVDAVRMQSGHFRNHLTLTASRVNELAIDCWGVENNKQCFFILTVKEIDKKYCMCIEFRSVDLQQALPAETFTINGVKLCAKIYRAGRMLLNLNPAIKNDKDYGSRSLAWVKSTGNEIRDTAMISAAGQSIRCQMVVGGRPWII